MGLDTLWAPWRMEFIQNICKDEGDCFMCRAARMENPRADLTVFRGQRAFVMLNRYPYNNGHLLICPVRHEGQLEALNAEEMAEVMALTAQAKRLLDRIMHPHGYNIGANLGRAAGAGCEAHFHMHIVPRWSGDTNFITTVGSTKVIPQSLEELWTLLRREWEHEAPEAAPC